MLINTHIGKDDKGNNGIMGDEFQNELFEFERQGKKRVEVLINTVGGVVIDGWNIYGAMKLLNSRGITQVDTLCIGIAASTGGWVFQAGKKRRMFDYSSLMMHNPHGADDEDSQSYKVFRDSIVTMLSSKKGIEESKVSEMMDATTFMTADECYSLGFCDEIVLSKEAQQGIRVVSNVIEKWKAGNLILNSYIQPKNNKLMNQVTNALGLHNEASEGAILEAVNKMKEDLRLLNLDRETEMKKHEDALNEAANALKEATDKYNALKEAHDKMCNEMEDAKKEAEEAEKKRNEEDCKNMIVDIAKTGRIENKEEVIKEWLNTALTIGKDKCKNLLEAIPLNVNAPKQEGAFEPKNVGDVNFVPTTPAELKKQLRKQNKL